MSRRKLLCLLLAGVMLFTMGLQGCGKKTDPQPPVAGVAHLYL